MIIELLFPLSLIFPGLWILQITKIKIHNIIERLAVSYIFSLAMMFSLLYIGSLLKLFDVAAFIFLAIVIVSFMHLFVLFVKKNWHKPRPFIFSLFSNISTEKLGIIISATGLLSIYAIFLLSSAILDSDVVNTYLPIAREIVKANEFVYGYDYNILLKPIGVSVLYTWTYVISGSTLSETFRLMPLVPILLLIVLNYAIATSATNSKTVGIISTAVFLVLPFHDRFLLYTTFYPDIFYYPLIFAAIYFLLKYFQSKQNNLLLLTGIAFGVASLLKAQTIYVLIAFLLVLFVLELRNYTKISVALCCLAPFYILVPSILANSIQSGGFHFVIPSFTRTQVVLFLFLSILLGICCYITIPKNSSGTKIDFAMIKCLIKKIGLLLIPFAVLSSLWYVNNLLRFGTLISTSSINLPNYDWALGVLQPLETVQQTVDVWHCLAYFIFMFVDPAVMGYVMLVPFLIGLFFVLRQRIENFGVLLLFSVILASVILSTVVISINLPSGYNPRDIFVLAPLITTISAVGIVSITSNFYKARDKMKRVFMSLLFVAYFGLLGYIHSVFVWFTSIHSVTMIGNFTASLGRILGLNLMQTSFQLSYADRVIFVGDNILRLIFFSLIVGTPALLLIICRYHKLFIKNTLKVSVHFMPSKLWIFIKKAFVILLVLSVIMIPRIEMLIAQGGIQGIKEFQVQNTLSGFYEPIVEEGRKFEGSILTFKAPSGLSYYLPENKVIDLTYPANLASLKDSLLSSSPSETVVKLRQRNINYILVNPSITQELDAALNFTLSKVTQNPELAILSQSFGSWKLYALGPYAVEKTLIPLSDWTVDSSYTNASFNLNSTESGISLYLEATDINSRTTICHLDVPKLDLSEYDYIVVNIKGSDTARVLIRFWLDDGSGFDVSYWKDPYTIINTPFDLSPHIERKLNGDVYIGLKSSDGTPSLIYILQISFVKLKGQLYI
ncbi:MAG: glycosyltransferase family 39 protein [archaeon]